MIVVGGGKRNKFARNTCSVTIEDILRVHCGVWLAVKVCSLRGEVTPVYGLTAVDQYLFVVRAWSTDIEVYDGSTYSFQRHLTVAGLHDVTDMAGCQHHRCLYLADCNSRAVHTVSADYLKVFRYNVKCVYVVNKK